MQSSHLNSFTANFILVIHFAWVAWMISGILLAVLGFKWPRLWGWRIFRIAHLIGLVGTATVPIWAGGICPLSALDWQMRAPDLASGQPQPFLVYWLDRLLYWDVDPLVLSLAIAAGALLTVIIFIFHPPWRYVRKGRYVTYR
jgi:Protein of Unknown function (DUF2784)